MIERHVSFEVIAEKKQDFEAFFIQEYRPAMASMPGFVNVELLREQENLQHYRMVIRFQTAEDSVAWRDSSLHLTLSPRFKSHYSSSNLTVFDVIA